MANETIGTDYRATLNLPKTEFPMRAELPKREPQRVLWWQSERVYERRLARNEKNPKWILHDGPPYANGEVHMGTFLNRVAKDVFVKFHLLDGKYANFVPGWDMHGLPIEFETLKHLKLDFRKVDPLELRARCRERALHWLDVQRDVFLRMGTLGQFEHPYRTLDPDFEATIVETLGDLAEAGQLYKGLRPTLWCIYDETALAEAEIEYKDHTSPSIYVRFPADPVQHDDLLKRAGIEPAPSEFLGKLSVLIWTTTPWTLPANAGVALKPEASYGIYQRGDEFLLLADELAYDVFDREPGPPANRIGGAAGSAFVGAKVRHPFLDRDSEIVGADYVELETGTGAVHTAPGHGADDFDTGLKFGLPVINPVDSRGVFTAEAGPYAGLRIFDANARIVDDLRASGLLFAWAEFSHSYPHCWRCKNPLIFRATAQWFIAMDVNRLRKRCAAKVLEVKWTPAWGEGRMLQMIENHPEWCISRQRTWGTPIPSLVCKDCNEAFLDPEVARITARIFRERAGERPNASDLWWTEPVGTFLPPGLACPKCRSTNVEKEFNIVDIWFESGVTHRAVLRHNPALHWPADLYLEGSDQYRGWFRSNLVTAVATAGAPPYKAVVSTGWVVDAEGRAMHKSTGNYLGAVEAMNKHGADVLRLWTSSVEFTADMRLGETLLESVSNVYRNLRYRLRMMLGLIEDLALEDLVASDRLEPIDQLALARLDAVARSITKAYETYNLHGVYLALIGFDEELSAFYIDALKEPMYGGARGGHRRRSAQTALFSILRAICALVAPILSFTSEEAWQAVPECLRGEASSVFDLDVPRGAERGEPHADQLAMWERLKKMRGIAATSESLRDYQLQAHVYAPATLEPALRALGDNLRESLMVSALTLEVDAALAADAEPRVVFSPAVGGKCSRCWKTLPLGEDLAHPLLCTPCAEIVRSLT